MKSDDWVLSKNTWISRKAILPGVWGCKGGGFLIRGEAKSPLTGKQQDVRRVLREARDQFEAKRVLQQMLAEIRLGGKAPDQTAIPIVSDFVVLYLAERVDLRKINSAAVKEWWQGFITNHLSEAPWFAYYCHLVKKDHIEKWAKGHMLPLIKSEAITPVTANHWLDKVTTIFNAACRKYELTYNPTKGVERFDTSTHRTYTIEQPNSLTPDEVPTWLQKAWQLKRRHYCKMLLGFLLGLRPSHIRPLRRKGPTCDILWSKKAIVIRRSHSRGQAVMEKGKTRKSHEEEDQILYLPKEVFDVVEWHAQSYETDAEWQSDLLFPGTHGKLESRAALQKPFAAICKAMGLTKKITPRGMRRTAKDLARNASLDPQVRKAISSHKTEKMESLYSTVNAKEMRESISKVAGLVGISAGPKPPTPPQRKGRGHLQLVR